MNLARHISQWWLRRTIKQMIIIAPICAIFLSLLLVGIHHALDGMLSSNTTDIIMFSISTITLLIFSASITMTLKSKQEFERLKDHFKEESIRDPLTGLYNRRFIDKELVRLRKQVQRELRNGKNSSLILVFMDMDDFKKINDDYGHLAGDGAICTVATIISDGIRDGEDLLGRYGGDEFCAAIMISDYKSCYSLIRQAAKITYRINKNMRKAIFFYGSHRIPLAMTTGIHIVDLNESDIMLELAKADDKMLKKKQRRNIGRNA